MVQSYKYGRKRADRQPGGVAANAYFPGGISYRVTRF